MITSPAIFRNPTVPAGLQRQKNTSGCFSHIFSNWAAVAESSATARTKPGLAATSNAL